MYSDQIILNNEKKLATKGSFCRGNIYNYFYIVDNLLSNNLISNNLKDCAVC